MIKYKYIGIATNILWETTIEAITISEAMVKGKQAFVEKHGIAPEESQCQRLS